MKCVVEQQRARLLDAAVVVFGRVGIAKATVEDVAAEAGVARATVYRWFPGGREELVEATIAAEVWRYLDQVREAAEGGQGPHEQLALLIGEAHRALAAHDVFQKVLDTEPERLLPQLTNAGPMALERLRALIDPMLDGMRLADGVERQQAVEWLARMMMSVVLAPADQDLDDPAAVRRLVDQLLAGVVADPTEG